LVLGVGGFWVYVLQSQLIPALPNIKIGVGVDWFKSKLARDQRVGDWIGVVIVVKWVLTATGFWKICDNLFMIELFSVKTFLVIRLAVAVRGQVNVLFNRGEIISEGCFLWCLSSQETTLLGLPVNLTQIEY
jgi:hypothetical protein